MRWLDWSAQPRLWGCVVAIGIAGSLVAWSHARSEELTPAEVVALRFPAAWSNVPAGSVPAVSAVAREESIFETTPSYALASTDASSAVPSRVLAYADPRETTSDDRSAAEREVSIARAPESRLNERRNTPRPAKPDNHILNDAQIASIKVRLKLTPDQQRYWPAVEAALRGIAYKMNKGRKKLATIDPDSTEVQQLKSAAIPLIMTFNEQQKSEVRQLAYVMGLQKLASQF